LLCTGVHGTSNGAPDSVCQNANMFPSGHNSAAATGPSPYSITVDAEQYAAGASLTGKTGYGCQLLKYFSKFAKYMVWLHVCMYVGVFILCWRILSKKSKVMTSYVNTS